MKTISSPRSTMIGSPPSAKATGAKCSRSCTVSPRSARNPREYAVAIPWAERLVALDSLSESNHQLLIRLHAANHDRSSALRAYHQCMRVLRREMGVDPGAVTRELFERILKAEPRATGEPASGPPGPIPQLQKVRALVGRAAEWQRLASAWQSAVEDGPRVAIISGEPEIGKTRLADELYHPASGRTRSRTQPLLCGTGTTGVCPDCGVVALRRGSCRLDQPQAAATDRIGEGWCRRSGNNFRTLQRSRPANPVRSARAGNGCTSTNR